MENLTEMMHRDWNLVNTDTNDYNVGLNNNHPHHSRLLSRKISDNNNNNNSDNHHHQLANNNNDVSAAIRAPKPLSNHKSSDSSYDTDGGIRRPANRSKHHHISSNNYEHLVSPRLLIRRHGVQPLKQVSSIPFQQQLSHKRLLTAKPSLNNSQNYDDRDEDANYEDDIRHRQIRPTRHARQTPTPPSGNHGTRVGHPSALVQHSSPLAATPSIQPLRIIFMRHSERANQALGPDWFNKAFRTNTYIAYDQNLPIILPKRRFDQAYEFDAPLTGE
jgi:hypothetical protein